MTASIPTASGNRRPIPFGRLLGAEALKSTDTRAARRLIAGAFLTVVVAVGLLLGYREGVQTYSGYVELVVEVLSLFVPFLLLLLMTGEWTQRTVLTTFLQEPRRVRVIAAKACWGVLLAVAGGALGLAVAALGVLLAGVLGSDTSWDVTLGEASSSLLYLSIAGLVAMALAVLVQHTIGAIVAYFVSVLIVSSVALMADLPPWLSLAQMYAWVGNGEWSGHAGTILLSLAVWIVLPGTIGVLRTVRREIN